jgi:hypothetical protein
MKRAAKDVWGGGLWARFLNDERRGDNFVPVINKSTYRVCISVQDQGEGAHKAGGHGSGQVMKAAIHLTHLHRGDWH